MSRSGLTRTKFPANDKLLPTSHATAATPKTSQFLLIGVASLCKAMVVFSRRLRLPWCRWAYRFCRGEQDGSKRDPASSLFEGACSSSAEQKQCRKSRHLCVF